MDCHPSTNCYRRIFNVDNRFITRVSVLYWALHLYATLVVLNLDLIGILLLVIMRLAFFYFL